MNRSTVAIRIANWATLAFLATMPWVGLCVVSATTGRDLGAGFQPAYLLVTLAVIASWWGGAYRGGRIADRVPVAWIWTLALGAILLSAVGVWRSPGLATPLEAWGRYGRQVIQWLLMAACALHLAVWLRGERRWRHALAALAVGLVFQGLYGLWQAVHFYDPGVVFAKLETVFTSNPSILSGSEELYLGRDFVGIPRVRGTACEPLYLGNYILMVLPWLLILALRLRRLIWLPVIAALLLAATWSRGAWLAAAPGALVALVVLWRLGRLRLGRILARTLPVVVLLGLAAHFVTEGRLLDLMIQRVEQSFSTEDWSNLTRWYSMQAAWRGFLLQPVFGLGWGQYGFHFVRLVDPMGLQSQFAWPVVNNYPLGVLCETGAIGFAALVASVWAITRRVWFAMAILRAGTPGTSGMPLRLVAAVASVTAVWSQLLTFSQYNLPHIWVALGFLLAVLAETTSRGEAT
jgi:hypothetical protein